MKKEDPIKNDDIVSAISKGRKPETFKFGELKNAYIAKKLDYVIDKVYLVRKNQYYKVYYSPTKGFKFQKEKM